jgi:hypothetical protein
LLRQTIPQLLALSAADFSASAKDFMDTGTCLSRSAPSLWVRREGCLRQKLKRQNWLIVKLQVVALSAAMNGPCNIFRTQSVL